MKCVIYLIGVFLLLSSVFAATSSSSINWASRTYIDNNYCMIGGNCTFSYLTVLNETVLHKFVNVSGDMNISGDLRVGGTTYTKRICIDELCIYNATDPDEHYKIDSTTGHNIRFKIGADDIIEIDDGALEAKIAGWDVGSATDPIDNIYMPIGSDIVWGALNPVILTATNADNLTVQDSDLHISAGDLWVGGDAYIEEDLIVYGSSTFSEDYAERNKTNVFTLQNNFSEKVYTKAEHIVYNNTVYVGNYLAGLFDEVEESCIEFKGALANPVFTTDLGSICYNSTSGVGGEMEFYAADSISFRTAGGLNDKIIFYNDAKYSDDVDFGFGDGFGGTSDFIMKYESNSARMRFQAGKDNNLILESFTFGDVDGTSQNRYPDFIYNTRWTPTALHLATSSTANSFSACFNTNCSGKPNGVHINGSLNLTNGNTFVNNIYGEIWNWTDGGLNFAIADAGVYYNGSGFLCSGPMSDVNGFTCTETTQLLGGTYLTVQHAGTYQLQAHISGEGSVAGGLYGIAIAKNFTRERDCYIVVDGTTSANAVSITCLKYFNQGDTINLLFEDETDPPKDFDLHSVNMNAWRVGN